MTPQAIGRAAVLALHDELDLSPKPGLVTPFCQGSHFDMDAQTFMRSLFALRRYFATIASLGAQSASFASLELCGRAAEVRMLAATGGVNTHRGSIFMLGLLCAAAGAVVASGQRPDAVRIRSTLLELWGPALTARARRPSSLPGGIAARTFGLRGASWEAASGFPILFEVAVPALCESRARGLKERDGRLDTLFHIMAVLDDSNLAHRGGLAGLRMAQRAAREFLGAGGMGCPDSVDAVDAICKTFKRRRLSPGGAADTLAAACWLHRLEAF
jgi:triphosphoribosyl-dephospho-CoA synthase